MSGAKHRAKGNSIEREIVKLHQDIGVHAERYPLSGASRFRGQGHDVDIYAFGVDEAPLVAEVKGRKGADGFRLLGRWLGDHDVLFLRRNRCEPLAVLPWRIWQRLLKEASNGHSRDQILRRGGAAAGNEVGADALPAVPAAPPALSAVTSDGDAPQPSRRMAHRQARG